MMSWSRRMPEALSSSSMTSWGRSVVKVPSATPWVMTSARTGVRCSIIAVMDSRWNSALPGAWNWSTSSVSVSTSLIALMIAASLSAAGADEAAISRACCSTWWTMRRTRALRICSLLGKW